MIRKCLPLLALLCFFAFVAAPALAVPVPVPTASTPTMTADAALIQVPVQVKLKALSGEATNPSSGKIFAGDLFLVSASLPDGIQGAIPEFKTEAGKEGPAVFPLTLEGVRILSAKITSSEIEFELTSYEPGPLRVVDVPLKKDDKIVGTLSLKELSKFQVEPLPQGEDIKAPLDPMGMRLPLWVVIFACILGVFFLGLLVWAIYKICLLYKESKARNAQSMPLAPPKTPLQVLQESVERLDSSDLLRSGAFKKYYFGISEAAKRFLAQRFRFPAEDLTTRELSYALQKISQAQAVGNRWIELFEEMDPVKFAKEIPSEAVARSLSQRVLSLAKESEVQEEPGQNENS